MFWIWGLAIGMGWFVTAVLVCSSLHEHTHMYMYVSAQGFTLYIKTNAFLKSILTWQQLQVTMDGFGPAHSLHILPAAIEFVPLEERTK